MGKAKKDKLVLRPNPIRGSLTDTLSSLQTVNPDDSKSREKFKEVDDVDPEYVDPKMTKKILKEARRQQKQLIDSESKREERADLNISLGPETDEEDEDDLKGFSEEAKRENFGDDVEIDPEDEKALEMFMRQEQGPSRTLGDIIMEKFTEKQTELESQFSDDGFKVQKLDPKIEAMYMSCKEVLTRYRSGKLPKAFKLIPRLTNWEQILHITDPTGWSAAAMYQATRIFTSNLKEKMAQRFFNLVLLPRIRDDIVQYKKLNFHLYQALRKALFKPGAFMKGFLIPLCESGTCTLRESMIVGSVLVKNSIPLLHSSAAMLKIAEMDYSGANSIFLKFFLDKKYALPYRVIDALVYHFLKFERDKRDLPVLWHQALLSFTTRYKEYMSEEQKESLFALLRAHSHPQITPEIRRELTNSKSRDEIMAEASLLNSLTCVKME